MAEHHSRSFPGVTPFLMVKDGRGQEALDFFVRAYGAEVVSRNLAPDGRRIMQAELRVNGGAVMLCDEFPEYAGAATGPAADVRLHLHVDDADGWGARAEAAGATVTMPIADQFWGDRYGQLSDPFGHEWSIGSPIRQG